MKATRTLILNLLLASTLLSACGKNPAGGSGGPTPDYCSPTNIKILASQINDLTQQFDDEFTLASTVPQSQLAPHIAALQTIRRAAQEQSVPGCLAQLKALQVTQMNTAIAVLLALLSSGDQNPGAVVQGLAIARQQHDQYVLELARLLDVTPTIITPAPTEPSTPTPEVTPTAAGAAAAPTSSTPQGPTILAVNPGPYPINLRSIPAEGSRLITTLDVGKSAVAVAETTDGLWVQVLVPGHPDQKAWVSASDVQLVSGTPSP